MLASAVYKLGELNPYLPAPTITVIPAQAGMPCASSSTPPFVAASLLHLGNMAMHGETADV